jgi:precorrin-4/cobalt-precorrin-4 C11-methyltransferase
MTAAEQENKVCVRLHTGDPSIYGAIREQMDELQKRGIPYESCPGVSSMFGASAALNLEYTLPGVSQTVIISRSAGRTPVPERESIRQLAAHHSTMVLFLSAGQLKELSEELISGGYSPETPAAIVYKASWPEEEKYITTVSELEATANAHHITKTALILVGDVIKTSHYEKSRLYAEDFSTEYREAKR